MGRNWQRVELTQSLLKAAFGKQTWIEVLSVCSLLKYSLSLFLEKNKTKTKLKYDSELIL